MKIETDYFTLQELSDGIFATIAKTGHGSWSNAGIVDLGNEVLVFDSLSTPSAGLELRKQAEKITRKKVKYLINSHYHGDHVFGNQIFIDTTIISTPLTDISEFQKGYKNDTILISASEPNSIIYRLDTALMLAILFTTYIIDNDKGQYYLQRAYYLSNLLKRSL